MPESKIAFDYMKVSLHKFTFRSKRIKAWVEENCEGLTLNLFGGETRLNVDEVSNDIGAEFDTNYHKDALKFVEEWDGPKFGTVVLDPPYSFRKSMEMYKGRVMSPFNALKDAIPSILVPNGIVITFGYHSVSMGKVRNFVQEKVLVMSHGGAIHDTIAVIERRKSE